MKTKKRLTMSNVWTLFFCAYVLWAVDVGMPVFEDTSSVYKTWVEERNG